MQAQIKLENKINIMYFILNKSKIDGLTIQVYFYNSYRRFFTLQLGKKNWIFPENL